MDSLSAGQCEVIALALLHGWRWEQEGPDCRPLLTNIPAGQKYCVECGSTKDSNQFSRNKSPKCLICFNRYQLAKYHKYHQRLGPT